MKIAFNPSTVAALTTPPNNKDITFDLRGRNIFARGVKFYGTDTNTWRDIKINNVSIGSYTLDLRNGSNTTLTNTNGVVTINSTWRPVVDNLTSDSTTSSLSAKQGKVLKALIDGKSNSDHNHDGRYVRYYAVTTLDCNNLAAGLTAARISATNAAHTNHSAYLYISDVGTPFQIQIPDSSIPYIYKRYYGSGKWSGWFKLNAGYADSAGSVAWANVTGKPSSYTPSAHTHAWNSLTHSSTTENQAILTNGKANGWKLQTLNIARWDNAANNAHSHANKSVLDGITSALVNSWNTAYNFVSNITGTDTDKVINKWEEIVNFLAGITEDNKLNTLLNSKLSIQQLSAKDILTTKTNNALFWVDTKGNASTITTGPFTDHPYALLSVTNYNQNAENYKFFYRSRLAFSSAGDIKVASCHHEYEYQQDETWYNVLTSKNSGISGSTIKLNGTSITVYSSGTADGRYVKKSGDTMQGVLTIDTTNFGALTIKRNDDANGASIQFRGKSSVYGYIGLNNSTKDKQFLRWSSDISRIYTILDTSSTYTSGGKGVINGTTITQVDNATNSTNSTNARKLVNWYSARPTSLNAQFGDGSLRIFYATSSTTEGKPAEDSHILHLAWDNTGGWDAQLAVHTHSGKVSTRAQNSGTWQPWKTLAFTTDIPSSLKNPYSFNVFGVVYDGSAAKTVTTSNFISQVNEDTSTITDGTMLITSYASNSGFADTNAVNVPYKRKAIHLWEYIKAKTDSLYATKGHNHDDRYLRLTGGWMSGDINFGGDNKIYWRRNTDSASISFKNDGDGDANSYMSFVTSDNGNEYFRWSHSSGSTNTEWMALRSDGLRVRGTKVSLEGHNHDDRYYIKAESNAKYITDITTSVNKLTFTRNGSNIIRDITVNVVHSQGQLTNIPNKNATTKASPGLLIYDSYDQTIGTNSYSSVLSINTGGTIQIAGNWGDDHTRNLYWRSQSDRNVADYPWKSWRTILDSENYSFTLDSRYYTESEVNSLLDAKLNRQNLSYGNWNPRGWNLAADYHYNGGDISISENNGKMYVSVDGCFWQNEGKYRVLDTSDIGDIRSSVTLHQYLSATDAAWYPLVWGGNAHLNTSDSTGAVYKSYDKLCWQTSSQTLYATNIRTNNINNLAIGGGIYWNPFAESTTDSTDAASITVVKAGVAGGTTLVLSQMNDTNDTIQFKTNTAARLYHNSYPILTTQNTYVNNNKGYINGTEITQVNNADMVDGYHENSFLRYRGATNTDQEATLWSQIGIKEYYGALPDGLTDTYNWGGVISLPGTHSRFEIYASHQSSSSGNGLYYRSGWDSDKKTWLKLIDSSTIGSQTVANAYHLRINAVNTWSTWYWAGQSGQPSWLWGSNDGTNMYVWNPNNFNVNTAQYLRSLGNKNCQTGRTQAYGDVYTYNTITGNTGSPTTYSSVIGFGRGIGGTVEIAGGWCNTHLYWRSLRDCCEDWFPWRTVLDSSNYTEFINNYYWANVKISASANTQTQPSVNTIYANNWFRSQGTSGWYSESYGGGICMKDSSWIRTYGGKSFYCDNQIYSSNSIRMGNILLEHTDEINNSADGGLNLNYRNPGNVSLCVGGGKVGIGTMSPAQKLDVVGNIRVTGQIIKGGSSQMWVNGRNGALLRETSVDGYHTLWSLKTTDGSWDFGEYNAGSDWNNIPVLSYITDSNYNSGNNETTYQIKFPLASGTIALTSNIPNPTNYYWANVKISASSSTTTSPTVSNLTATNSIRLGAIHLEYTNEINSYGGLLINYRSSADVDLCQGGGNVCIGATLPTQKLDVRGNIITKGLGIQPYYLSKSVLLPTIRLDDGYTYRCLEISATTEISCIIADRAGLMSERGILIKFNKGYDGQIILLKDLQSYGSGNGYFWVMPSGCKIISADNSSILVGQNQISNTYDDGRSRFLVYSSVYSVWIEFLCSNTF